MSSTRASSTGLVQSTPIQLDRHYRSAQVEYEGALRSVGIEPGWTVLDAGCGGGSFLPMLSDLVGPNGSLIALDLAPENIGRIDQWAREAGLSSRLRTHAASITSMPLDDATVDCVWSANVMQYLSEPEAKQAIAEMKRVLKPGGLLAVKDFDASLINWSPFDQDLRDRFMFARRLNFLTQGVLGTFCGPGIPARLRAAGLREFQRKTYLIERWAPFRRKRARA